MCATSINTFVRAFNAPVGKSIAKEAGNYKNTECASTTKILLGLVSFGILYGLAALIEHVANVRPKIREFAGLNCALYNAIVNRGPGKEPVTIQIEPGKDVTFRDIEGQIYIIDGDNRQPMGVSSFEHLLAKIHQDALASPDLYSGLDFTPTIGASISLEDAVKALPPGGSKLIEAIQLALYGIKMPSTMGAYFQLLSDKFRELTSVGLSGGAVSMLPAKWSDDEHSLQKVEHQQFIEYFQRISTRAFLN